MDINILIMSLKFFYSIITCFGFIISINKLELKSFRLTCRNDEKLKTVFIIDKSKKRNLYKRKIEVKIFNKIIKIELDTKI